MVKNNQTTSTCPCGTSRTYPLCCGQFHCGESASTAEQLMRSRYVAFVMNNEQYLLNTWHASTRPTTIEFEPSLKWLGLKIVATHPDGDQATVEFIARYRIGGASAARLHEVSRFVREQGLWFYVDGDQKS